MDHGQEGGKGCLEQGNTCNKNLKKVAWKIKIGKKRSMRNKSVNIKELIHFVLDFITQLFLEIR